MRGSAIRERLGDERGVTLTEMLVVLLILGIILGGMTTLFVSAGTSQVDQTNRVAAQQEARLALDALRREIHCASGVTGTPSTSSITVNLGSYCPTAAGQPSVTWCTEEIVPSKRYALWRHPAAMVATCGSGAGAIKRADYLKNGAIFASYNADGSILATYDPASGGVLATLPITLRVDVTPDDAKQVFTLRDDIVLRNSGRS